jgi:hypothetical protein
MFAGKRYLLNIFWSDVVNICTPFLNTMVRESEKISMLQLARLILQFFGINES